MSYWQKKMIWWVWNRINGPTNYRQRNLLNIGSNWIFDICKRKISAEKQEFYTRYRKFFATISYILFIYNTFFSLCWSFFIYILMRVHAIKRFLKNNCYKSYSENGSEVSVYIRDIHNVITDDSDARTSAARLFTDSTHAPVHLNVLFYVFRSDISARPVRFWSKTIYSAIFFSRKKKQISSSYVHI